MGGVSQASNPNWKADAGIRERRCVCGHGERAHPLVGNKGCHATLNQPTEYRPGSCDECRCRRFKIAT